jgi:magnesium chelatase family protein
VSLAHHAILFLDELREFKRHVLEVLRQPLEKNIVTIAQLGSVAPELGELRSGLGN